VYAYAKRGQVILAEQFAKEYPDVAWVTVHPGWTDTPAVEEAFGDQKKYLAPLREPWQGAEGVAWLTQTDRKNLENGEFYLDRTTQTKHLAGPFFSEGSYTKNKPEEVAALMENLKKAAGI
jgi:dehydrogenase/reductase SDR family protein 12